MAEKDRRAALLASTVLNGIDYVEVASADQQTLRVHFLNPVAVMGTLTDPPAITGGVTIRTVAVDPVTNADWAVDAAGRPELTLRAGAPGDFSFYTLTLASPVLDPFFTSAQFSFKVLCPTDLDCEAPPEFCPPLEGDLPPIDYLAKDYLSFNKALSDFSALRYPEWQERSEADFGVMFMEALSALADDLSYTQDRVAAEATLETVTQRRSIVRLARLVDYEPRPATVARVLLQLDVQAGPIPAGLPFSAPDPAGGSIDFETGTGLRDTSTYPADPRWNRGIKPYYWNDDQRCLHAGATEMWVEGHGFGFYEGQPLLIDTLAINPTDPDILNPADPPIREVVHITAAIEEVDQLFPGPPNPPAPVTHLFWSTGEALKFDHDLTETAGGILRTVLAGNLVPATQGRRISETFAVETPPAAAPETPLTFFRLGPNSAPDFDTPVQLFTLREAPLAWLAPETPDPTLDDAANWPLPEIALVERPAPPSTQPREWNWRRRLLDAEPFERAFTVDPARYRHIARNSDGSDSYDYAGDDGETIRFGDGVFGEIPEAETLFDLTYRTGAGAAGNVAADSIVRVGGAASVLVSAVTNPFPAAGGAEMETDEQVRRRAPHAFRARQFRIVRPEDYVAAAQGLPWVQRAGTTFRWTGSWLTVFTAADPRGSQVLAVDDHTQLINLLNRRRMAGYESYVPAPRYVSIDLQIMVCARPDAFQGDVHEALLAALSARRKPDGTTGFFFMDNWSFGQPLERSQLESAIQDAYGVSGVVAIRYRRRGVVPGFVNMPDTVTVASDEILRVENNPSLPEHGTLKLIVEGGK
jgi:hypothetical protein